MKTFSLKTKLAFTVTVLIILFMSLMSFFTLAYFEMHFKQTISQQEFTMVSVIAQEIDYKLQKSHQMLIETAKLIKPENIVTQENAQRFLDNKLGLISFFDNHIYLFTPDGKILAEAPFQPNRRGVDFSHRDYLKKTLSTGQPTIGDPYISSLHGHPAVMLTVPIYNANGDLLCIFAGSLDLLKDNFLSGLAKTKIGQTGYLYIFNTDRTIIIHPDMDRVMQQDVPFGANKLFDKAINGFEGTEETVTSRGSHVLASVKTITHTNWLLVANHPVSEAYAPIDKARKYFIWGALVGILLLVVITKFTVAHFIRPLSQFTRHVDEMPHKTGRDRLFFIDSTDEIGALSRAFNKMVLEADQQKATLQNSKELYQTVVDFSSDVAFWLSPCNKLLYISPNCERLTGYSDTDFFADPALLSKIVHPDDQQIWQNCITRDSSIYPAGPVEFRILTKQRELRWVVHYCRPVYDESGEFLGIRGSHSDCTNRKKAEEQLRYLSWHDQLTDLYNRNFFEQELQHYRLLNNVRIGIIICDVDGLKLINDTLGHTAGDKLIVDAAAVIRRSFSDNILVARIGGDEFVILLPNADQTVMEQACQQIRASINDYNQQNPVQLLSISIGFAVSSDAGETITTLFKQADDNMYQEKMHHDSTRSAIFKR